MCTLRLIKSALCDRNQRASGRISEHELNDVSQRQCEPTAEAATSALQHPTAAAATEPAAAAEAAAAAGEHSKIATVAWRRHRHVPR